MGPQYVIMKKEREIKGEGLKYSNQGMGKAHIARKYQQNTRDKSYR